MVDLGLDVLPEVAGYNALAEELDADRNRLVEQAAVLAEEWWRLARAHPMEADELAALMHDATLAGVDPATSYRPVIDAAAALQRIRVLRVHARERSGEAYKFIEAINDLKMKLRQEAARRRAEPALSERYRALSAPMQQLYRRVRDFYEDRFNQTEEALQALIERSNASDWRRYDLQKTIREQFKRARVEAPYFPLTRFGNYWVYGERPGPGPSAPAEKRYHLAESAYEQRGLIRQLRTEGFAVQHGARLENFMQLQGVSSAFIDSLIALVDEVGPGGHAGTQFKEHIYQIYLATLPELSIRKHLIHRKKRKGYSQDALRAFAHNAFHGSYQLAKLRRRDRLEAALQAMREAAPRSADPNKAGHITNEMHRRHEWIMNPTSATWAQAATSLGFAWYLGLTPAAALVNVSQTPLIAYPVLAARYGWKQAGQALLQATRDYFKGGFEIGKRLSGDELNAYDNLVRDGVLDKTYTHDLAALKETPSNIYSPLRARVMGVIAFLFHRAERFNREVTALAAYRLARGAHANVLEAERFAAQTVWDAHFDYSNANKARFMQSDAARVLLMFRQFSLNKGASPAARRRLTGILGMHAMAAGALGLPLMSLVMGVLNAVFDDEDEPFDAETEFRQMLSEAFGPIAGNAIARGLVEGLADVGLSERVSLDDLWFRAPDRSLEGRGLVEWWTEQLLGPLGGLAFKAGTAYDLAQQGHLGRALEAAVPKALRDGLRALRYADEGVQTLRGDPIVERLNAWQLLVQGVGFVPGEVAKQYDANRAVKFYEKRLLDRRRRLVSRWWLARQAGDREGVAEALAAIKAFNAKNRPLAITGATLARSMRTRIRYRHDALPGGLHLAPRLRPLEQAVQF